MLADRYADMPRLTPNIERTLSAEGRIAEAAPAVLTPGHLALIGSTWRMAWVLATFKRDQLLDGGRKNELDELATEAREVKETMGKALE